VYIERNPVREKAEPHRTHGKFDGPDGLAARWLHRRDERTHADDKAFCSALRASTRTGRPLGTDRLIARVEFLAGRWLRPLPPGRPRKANKDKKRCGNQVAVPRYYIITRGRASRRCVSAPRKKDLQSFGLA